MSESAEKGKSNGMALKVCPAKAFEVVLPSGPEIFAVESEWECFVKLRSLKGEGFLIIYRPLFRGPFSELFADVFSRMGNVKHEEVTVVAGSPDLVAALNQNVQVD